jgi:hypothetical protein
VLPNFLIVGAGRSGTTSLYEYLRQHPQVFMSRVKEPNYFAFEGEIPHGPGAAWLRATSVRTREAYEALFAEAGSARAIGEASARYLRSEGAPERIHALLPDARLVGILRNPVGPLVPSTWRHHLNTWAIRDVVRPELRPDTRAALLEFYRDDTLRLQQLIGRDLSAWLK